MCEIKQSLKWKRVGNRFGKPTWSRVFGKGAENDFHEAVEGGRVDTYSANGVQRAYSNTAADLSRRVSPFLLSWFMRGWRKKSAVRWCSCTKIKNIFLPSFRSSSGVVPKLVSEIKTHVHILNGKPGKAIEKGHNWRTHKYWILIMKRQAMQNMVNVFKQVKESTRFQVDIERKYNKHQPMRPNDFEQKSENKYKNKKCFLWRCGSEWSQTKKAR